MPSEKMGRAFWVKIGLSIFLAMGAQCGIGLWSISAYVADLKNGDNRRDELLASIVEKVDTNATYIRKVDEEGSAKWRTTSPFSEREMERLNKKLESLESRLMDALLRIEREVKK